MMKKYTQKFYQNLNSLFIILFIKQSDDFFGADKTILYKPLATAYSLHRNL